MNQSLDIKTRSVRQCVDLIKQGLLTSEQLVQECLNAIDRTDASIGAWKFLDRDHALTQARALDNIRRSGKPLGDLHGIPVGLKDIIDTSDYPTERGSVIYAGRQPVADSAVVEKLREAGAVIMGKTVTTEFAFMHPAETRNPHHAAHSPGGSSSGSAAAVAAGHIPLALGSQTNGSVIRPASFCGIYGFKPSRGIISRRGVFQTSATLDHVGGFAQDLGDLALLADILGGYDASDNLSYLAPRPGMLEGYLAEVPVEPALVWLDLPYADRYSSATVAGFEELIEAMGTTIERIPAPDSFSDLIECHQIIYDYEIFRCLTDERENHESQLSDSITSIFERAQTRSLDQYQEAKGLLQSASAWFETFFHDYDAIITPSAPGEAVLLKDGTGDPVCSTIWTLCGLPCVSLPLLNGDNNLPIGVQLITAENQDDRLLRTSRWLLNQLRSTANN